MKKFFAGLMLVAVVAFAAFAVVPAQAQDGNPPVSVEQVDTPEQEPVGFDLAYISELLQALILATVPVLAGMGAKLLSAKIQAEKQKLSTDQLWALELFIKTAVYAAEQMKAKEFITDKLDFVTSLVQAWLDERKIALDAFEIRARIEAVVKKEFNPSKALPAG